MALTYTIAGLQAELDALETARKARSWATAWDEYMDYASVYAGLIESGSLEGRSFRFPSPDVLRKSLEMAQELATRTGDKPRVLHTRLGYSL